MKKMKVLAITGALVGTVGLLAGCGGTADNTDTSKEKEGKPAVEQQK